VLIGVYFLFFDVLAVFFNRRLMLVRLLTVQEPSRRYALMQFILVGLAVIVVVALLSPIILADQDRVASWSFIEEHTLPILLCGALGIVPIAVLMLLPSVAKAMGFLSSVYVFLVGAILVTGFAYVETRASCGRDIARSLVYSALPAALGYSTLAFTSMNLILGLTYLITRPLGNGASECIWYKVSPHFVAFAAYLIIFMYAAYIRLALCEQLAKT